MKPQTGAKFPKSVIPQRMWVKLPRRPSKEEPDQVEVFRIPLRERLPNIPIPLRPGEQDAVLQLQPLIDDCYSDGRHHRTNYGIEPEPRLSQEDADWADALLREQGYRT